MSSDGSYDPQADTRDCISARYTPLSNAMDVDVDGITVAVASVVVNICLRVLIVWSPKDVDAGVWASLLQIYPVLLSTLSSINRKQLSLFDASFALVLCSSPFTVYLVAISICKLCGVATCLYKRVKSCHLISLLGALVAILWFGLSMTLRLSDHAFIDSNLCKGSTFKDWLWDLSDLCSKVLAPGALGPPAVILFAVPFDLLLLRRWHQVKKEFLTGLEGRSKLWVWSTAPLRFVRCAWSVIEDNHRWYKVLLFVYLDISWAIEVITIAVSATGKAYVLSYGQVFFIFSALPPLASTIKFVYSYRGDLLRFLKRFPKLFLDEMKYIATGKESAPQGVLPTTCPIPLRPQGSPSDPPPEESRQPESSTTGPVNNLPPVAEQTRKTNVNAPNSLATRERSDSTSVAASSTAQRLDLPDENPRVNTDVEVV